MRKKYFIAFLVGLMVVALATAYYCFDPVEVRWMPRCIWKVATGTDCPGCGSQRMAHALMHGDLSSAWHANAYALCMLPLIGLMACLEFFRESFPRLYGRVHSPWVIRLVVISVFVWWIMRNLI